MLLAAEIARQQVLLESLTQKLCHISNIQPMHQVEPMNLNGPDTDLQGPCNLSIGMAKGDEAQDLTLSRGNMRCSPKATIPLLNPKRRGTFMLYHRYSFSIFIASVANDGNCVNEMTDMRRDPVKAIPYRMYQMRPLP